MEGLPEDLRKIRTLTLALLAVELSAEPRKLSWQRVDPQSAGSVCALLAGATPFDASGSIECRSIRELTMQDI